MPRGRFAVAILLAAAAAQAAPPPEPAVAAPCPAKPFRFEPPEGWQVEAVPGLPAGREGCSLTLMLDEENVAGLMRIDAHAEPLPYPVGEDPAQTIFERYRTALVAQGDFEVLDGGLPGTLAHWESAPAGLAVAVVLDTSLSMQGEKIEDARGAAAALIRELDDRDRVMLMSFSDEVLDRAPLGPDRGAAAREVDKLAAAGGTALLARS